HQLERLEGRLPAEQSRLAGVAAWGLDAGVEPVLQAVAADGRTRTQQPTAPPPTLFGPRPLARPQGYPASGQAQLPARFPDELFASQDGRRKRGQQPPGSQRTTLVGVSSWNELVVQVEDHRFGILVRIDVQADDSPELGGWAIVVALL